MTTATDTSIPLSSRVVRSKKIDFAEIDDTVVMMDVDEGRYYELDPVAARVWALIEPAPRVAEMCEALAAEYEVASETCRDEVGAFLKKLSRLAVVRIRQPHEEAEGNEAEGNVATSDDTNGGAASVAGRSGREAGITPGARLAWTPPTVRVMSIEARTRSGTKYNTYAADAAVGKYPTKAPPS